MHFNHCIIEFGSHQKLILGKCLVILPRILCSMFFTLTLIHLLEIFSTMKGQKGHVPLDIIGFHLPLRREMLQRRYSWRLEDASSLKRVLQAVKQFQLLLRFQHEHLLQQLSEKDCQITEYLNFKFYNTLPGVTILMKLWM